MPGILFSQGPKTGLSGSDSMGLKEAKSGQEVGVILQAFVCFEWVIVAWSWGPRK